MTTKQIIGGSLAFGFVVGAMIAGLAIMAACTDAWYKEVIANPSKRIYMVDYAQEQTVTVVTFKGDMVQRIEKEP